MGYDDAGVLHSADHFLIWQQLVPLALLRLIGAKARLYNDIFRYFVVLLHFIDALKEPVKLLLMGADRDENHNIIPQNTLPRFTALG